MIEKLLNVAVTFAACFALGVLAEVLDRPDPLIGDDLSNPGLERFMESQGA